jgi:hypothetical protein
LYLKFRKLPFYKISILLKKTEQNESCRAITAVREFKETELDKIWHVLHVKCEEKWGRKLNSFDCVRISKRSPDYLKYISDRQQKKFNRYDDILSPDYTRELQIKNSSASGNPPSVNGRYRN